MFKCVVNDDKLDIKFNIDDFAFIPFRGYGLNDIKNFGNL